MDAGRQPVHAALVSLVPDDVLRRLTHAEIAVAARVAQRDPATMTTAEAVAILRAFGLDASQRAPLVETEVSIPESMLQAVLALLCERYGAGLHKKPRQRVLTVTAPRAFVDDALSPLLGAMLDIVTEWQHAQMRALLQALEATAPKA